MSRLHITFLASAGLVLASASYAQPPDRGGGNDKSEQKAPGGGKDKAEQKGGGEKKAKHKHVNASGKQKLGAKLKQDGKHNIEKLKGRDVVAEVKGGKVKNMSAGDLPMKRVKTKTKVAYQDFGVIRASWSPGFQLAQYDPWYYGYCFDDGYEFYCYWYPEEEVDYEGYEWEDYDPYY